MPDLSGLPPVIVFDAFDTLIDTPDRRHPYSMLLKGLGDDDANQLRRRAMTENRPIDAFAHERGMLYLMPTLRSKLNAEIRSLRLFDDVAPTLSALRHAGKRIAVCSNLAAEYGHAVRRLLPAVDAHLMSFEVGAIKPEAEIYHACCNTLGCTPRDVLFVGNSPCADVHGPAAVGMQARHLDRRAGMTLKMLFQPGQTEKKH